MWITLSTNIIFTIIPLYISSFINYALKLESNHYSYFSRTAGVVVHDILLATIPFHKFDKKIFISLFYAISWFKVIQI